MNDTADQLERQIETHRANVEDTLDKLKGRLSVEQVVDDFGQFVGLEDARATLAVAGRQVRENPLALGLIGIGLAWLLLGRGASEQGQPDTPGGHRDRPDTGLRPATGHGDDTTRSRDPRKDEGDTLAETIAGGVAGVTGRASAFAEDFADRVGQAAAGVAGRVKDLGADAADRMHAGNLIRPIGKRIERQPLLLGGIALIAGAVIGAALPRTRTEDRLLGDTRDRLLQDTREVTQALKNRAAEAAQRSDEAAVKAAEDEGLAPLGDKPGAEGMNNGAAPAMDEPADQAQAMRAATGDGLAGSMGTGARTGRVARSRT